MLEDVIDGVWWLFAGFADWSPSTLVLVTVVAFTVVTSFVLTAFTTGSRMFTMPICFILLFFAGVFSNYLGRGVRVPGGTDMQVAILLAAAGQMVMGFLLLVVFKTGDSKHH